MKFENLLELIRVTHTRLLAKALQKVNSYLTIRNWLIGLYIIEYEQRGEDRAVYGKKVLKTLENRLHGIKGMSESQLYLYREFYSTYPQISLIVSGIFAPADLSEIEKFLTASGKYTNSLKELCERVALETCESTHALAGLPPEKLVDRLSFSHFIELMKSETAAKRIFYEVESIKNNWSVRELKRAIDTLLFERTGLSANKDHVISKVKKETAIEFKDIIRNPYLLEFLDLDEKQEFSEKDLESAIINHIQKFPCRTRKRILLRGTAKKNYLRQYSLFHRPCFLPPYSQVSCNYRS